MQNTFCKHVNVPFELSLDSLNGIQARVPNRNWPMMLKFFESDPNLLNFWPNTILASRMPKHFIRHPEINCSYTLTVRVGT